jgi:O-antigen/teichoic acid export membrane protein
MSIETDTLLTLAEIAATFAGFAALVSAIRRRSEDPETMHDILRLRVTISSSVVIVILALIPIGLANYGLSEVAVWRISGIVFLILSIGVIWSFLRIYRPVEDQFPRDEWSVRVFVVLQVAIVVALLVAVLNIAPELSYAVYITALVCYLSQAAYIFVRFVESTLSPHGF